MFIFSRLHVLHYIRYIFGSEQLSRINLATRIYPVLYVLLIKKNKQRSEGCRIESGYTIRKYRRKDCFFLRLVYFNNGAVYADLLKNVHHTQRVKYFFRKFAQLVLHKLNIVSNRHYCTNIYKTQIVSKNDFL